MEPKKQPFTFNLCLFFLVLAVTVQDGMSMDRFIRSENVEIDQVVSNVSLAKVARLPEEKEGLKITIKDKKFFSRLTDDFSVTCSFNNTNETRVNSIILASYNPKRKMFEGLLSISHQWPTYYILKPVNAKPSGKIENDGVSFIKLEWRYPPKEAATRYVCVLTKMTIPGFHTKLVVSAEAKTMPVTIDDLADQVGEIKKENDDKEDEIDEIQEMLNDTLKLVDMMDKKVLQNVEYLFNKTDFVFRLNNQILYRSVLKFDWDVAKLVCLYHGGHLAEFTYDQLRAMEPQMLNEGVAEHERFWVGYTRILDHDIWVYSSTGLKIDGLPWREGRAAFDLCATFALNDTAYDPDPCTKVQYALCSRDVLVS